jgi:hypothetical protein
MEVKRCEKHTVSAAVCFHIHCRSTPAAVSWGFTIDAITYVIDEPLTRRTEWCQELMEH